MLMHRRLWHGYRGFSEKLLGWGWNDCDLASRVCQTLPWMTLSGLGVLSIHMEHEPNVGKRAQIPALRRSNWGQVYPYTTQAEANDPNWGLADFELPVARARVRVAETAVAALHTVDTGALVPPEELANLPRELQDKNVLAAMARALGKLAEKRLVGKECLQDRAALALLGWYAAHRYPRRFLDVGIRQHEGAAAVVGALCPPVEIYAADLWDGEVEYVETPSAIAVGLEAAGHRGYLQFLNGDPQSSMARVARLMPGSRNVDLAYIRECCLGTGFAEFVALAFDHLAPGGALVFRAVSRQSTKRVWEHLQQQARLAARFAASDAFTGMAFAGAGETASAAAEPVELHGVGEKLAWGEVSPALLWQFVRALRHPGRPDQLLRRALRCFFRTGFTRPHA
jgi:hypothetical protein